MGGKLLNGYRVSVWDEQRVLAMNSGGNGCITMPLKCTLENP